MTWYGVIFAHPKKQWNKRAPKTTKQILSQKLPFLVNINRIPLKDYSPPPKNPSGQFLKNAAPHGHTKKKNTKSNMRFLFANGIAYDLKQRSPRFDQNTSTFFLYLVWCVCLIVIFGACLFHCSLGAQISRHITSYHACMFPCTGLSTTCVMFLM